MTSITARDLIVIVTDNDKETMRNTTQRDLIYRIVMQSCDHPAADEIYHRARQIMPKISMGTVYRNLKQLSECGKIREIRLSGDGNRYDRTLGVHAHFYCRVCGRVTDVETVNISEPSEMGKVETTDLMFGGVCRECLNKNAE